MSKKEKPNIKKLEYPLWFNITFYCLTILVPIVSIMTQGFQSHNTMFKISFGLVASSLLLWSFIHKFIISNIETTIRTRKVALEHDYEIEVGSSEKIKYLWFNKELWLTIINLIQIVIIGGFLLVLVIGLEAGAIALKGAAYLIGISYAMAYITKLSYILNVRDKEEKTEVDDGQKEPTDGTKD